MRRHVRSADVCPVPATVVSGTDATDCPWLLQIADNRWLIPLQTDVPEFKFVHSQRVRIRYTPIQEVVSPCGSAEPVIIHCIELVENRCRFDATPTNEPWLRAATDRVRRGGYVQRGRLGNQWFYVVSDYFITIVYDCRGNEYCRYEGKMLNDCARMVNTLKQVETWSF